MQKLSKPSSKTNQRVIVASLQGWAGHRTCLMLRMSLAATRRDLGGPNSPEAFRERGENLEQTSCVREIRHTSIGTSHVVFPHKSLSTTRFPENSSFRICTLCAKGPPIAEGGPILLGMTTTEALAIHETGQPPCVEFSKPKLPAPMPFFSFPIYRTGVPHRLLVSTRPAVFRSLLLTLA